MKLKTNKIKHRRIKKLKKHAKRNLKEKIISTQSESRDERSYTMKKKRVKLWWWRNRRSKRYGF